MEELIGHTNSTTSVELDTIGYRLFGDRFIGVFSADEVPHRLQRNTYMILNTDPSYKEGVHWCSLMVGNDGIPWFYDSYRRSYKSLSKYWVNRKWMEVTAKNDSNQPEQSMVSEICGSLCLAAIAMFIRYGSDFLYEV